MHREEVVIRIIPFKSSLQNNYTVLGIEFETKQRSNAWVIPDLDLFDLSLWLADLDAAPVITSFSFCAAIGSIPQSELVLSTFGYFIDRDKVVFVVELVDGWEVCVMLALVWHERF